MLCTSAYQRYRRYCEVRASKGGLGGACIVDLDQGADEDWARASDNWPCMATHGTVMMWASGVDTRPKIATGREHVGSLGWHLFKGASMPHSTSPMCAALALFTSEELKVMADRSVHLPSLSSFIFFTLSSFIRLETTRQFRECSSCRPTVLTLRRSIKKPLACSNLWVA